jgi:hypothetical protein
VSARRTPQHATLYDFRDVELMHKIVAEANGSKGVTSAELSEALGFDEGDRRPVGIRLAWMKRYGMVLYDDRDQTWRLTAGGGRVIAAQQLSREIEIVDRLPDESMVEVMAHVTSRYRHGQSMLAHLLRREFLYGTQKR